MTDINYVRRDQGLCLHQIGAQIGISDSNVSKWLRDTRQIPFQRLNSLAKALGLDIIPDSLHSDLLIFLKAYIPEINPSIIHELTTLISCVPEESKLDTLKRK